MNDRTFIVVFAVCVIFVVLSSILLAANAVKAGNECEFYRYSRQIDTSVACIDYLKQHP